jgi:small subunit ribosomal protein S16
MLKIRLTRIGKRKEPHYRIVVIEHTKAAKGKSIEIIGFYNSLRDPYLFKIKEDRLRYWLNQGAHLSETVKSLLKKEKIALK